MEYDMKERCSHIHVCDVSAAPCDDPEDQMVVAVSEYRGDVANPANTEAMSPITGATKILANHCSKRALWTVNRSAGRVLTRRPENATNLTIKPSLPRGNAYLFLCVV